jgi:hypothetical protein
MQKQKTIFEKFIKNSLYKAERVLKLHLYLLDFGIVLLLLVCLIINVLLCRNMVGEMEKQQNQDAPRT